MKALLIFLVMLISSQVWAVEPNLPKSILQPSGAIVFGASFVGLPKSVAQKMQISELKALLITGVEKGSVAQKSGLMVEDVLVSYDGKPITNPSEMQMAVKNTQHGQTVSIGIIRGTKQMSLTAVFN